MQSPSLEESDLQFAMKLQLEEMRPKLDVNPDQVTWIVNIQSSNNIVDLCRICNVRLQKQMTWKENLPKENYVWIYGNSNLL